MWLRDKTSDQVYYVLLEKTIWPGLLDKWPQSIKRHLAYQSGEHSNHVVTSLPSPSSSSSSSSSSPSSSSHPRSFFQPRSFFSTAEFFFNRGVFFFNRGVFFFNRGVFFQPRSFLFALQLLLHLAVNPICFSCLNAAVLGLGLLNPPFKPLPFSPNHP